MFGSGEEAGAMRAIEVVMKLAIIVVCVSGIGAMAAVALRVQWLVLVLMGLLGIATLTVVGIVIWEG